MTLRTGKNKPARQRAGFTLVELLVVMGLIGTMCALAAPSFSRFFRGRTQSVEIRRFISLTHYAQSRAVSEGVPMLLWIDAKAGTYGLEQEPGYADNADTNAVQYDIGRDLQIEVVRGTGSTREARTVLSQPAIRFLPDGGADAGSVAGV